MKKSLRVCVLTVLIGIVVCSTPGCLFTGQTNSGNESPVLSAPHYYIRPLPLPMGFATVGEGITGGEGGTEVTVTSAFDFLTYATKSEPYIINVVDTIELVRGIGHFPERNGAYYIASHKTIRGVGTNATIMYGGLRLAGVRNVIIQNLTFDGTYDPSVHDYKHQLEIGETGPAHDAIEITHGSENIWVTQNTFRRYSDECLSINFASTNVTLSWNRFDDPVTGKEGMMILIGSSDAHTDDAGRLNTTVHHNYMASRTRHPRVRFGKVHIFNNYYHNIASYGIAATTDAQILVEGNYFENVTVPWHIGYGASPPGYLVERGNIFVDTPVPPTNGRFSADVFDPSRYYGYTLEDPRQIRGKIMKNAGAGTGEYSGNRKPVPALIQPLQPHDGGAVTVQPMFVWNAARFADTYEFRLEDTEGTLLFETTLIDTLLVLPFELKKDRVYYWRVRALNESGGSVWTEQQKFLTVQK